MALWSKLCLWKYVFGCSKQRKKYIRTWQEGSCLEVKERNLKRNQTSYNLILDFQMWENNFCHLCPLAFGIFIWQPKQTNTHEILKNKIKSKSYKWKLPCVRCLNHWMRSIWILYDDNSLRRYKILKKTRNRSKYFQPDSVHLTP